MKNQIYVANLSETVDENQLRELFSPYGEVTAVELSVEEKTKLQAALVSMAAEKLATKAMNELNGQEFAGRPLNISYADVDLKRPLIARQRKILDSIAEALGEKDEIPLRQLEAIVQLCGASFAQALLKETEAVEAAGGLKTASGDRQRSKGGVFFYLARFRMIPPVRVIIYNRKGRLPDPPPDTPDESAPKETQQDS